MPGEQRPPELESVILAAANELTPETLAEIYDSMRLSSKTADAERRNTLLNGWQALETVQCVDDSRHAKKAAEHLAKVVELSGPAASLTDKTYRQARLGLCYLPVFESIGKLSTNGEEGATTARSLARHMTSQALGKLLAEAVGTPRSNNDLPLLSKLATYSTMIQYDPAGNMMLHVSSPREAGFTRQSNFHHDSSIHFSYGSKQPVRVRFTTESLVMRGGSTVNIGRIAQEIYRDPTLDGRIAGQRVQALASMLAKQGRSESLNDVEKRMLTGFGARIYRQLLDGIFESVPPEPSLR